MDQLNPKVLLGFRCSDAKGFEEAAAAGGKAIAWCAPDPNGAAGMHLPLEP